MIDTTLLEPAKPHGGLSSFGNLLQMILGFDETADSFNAANYLQCLGLLPGSRPKPTHPFHFPTGFPPEGPMDILPAETVEAMERAFAKLRDIADELDDGDGGISDELLDEAATTAMAAVRRIGLSLGYRRWDSGETMVRMFQLSRALPSDAISDAELVQCLQDYSRENYVWEDPEESNNRVSVSVLRLVFRLSDSEPIEEAIPAKFREWDARIALIGAVHNALFPGEHCIVELRDRSGATVSRSEPIGPPYAEVMAQYDAIRKKNA